MKKTFLFLVVVLFFTLLPIDKTYAYQNGYLETGENVALKNGSVYWLDNNLSTSYTISRGSSADLVEFYEPVNITEIFYAGSASSVTTLDVYYADGGKVSIKTDTFAVKAWNVFKFNNVKKIAVSNTMNQFSVAINELDIKATPTNGPIKLEPIKNLMVSNLKQTSFSLSWQVPQNAKRIIVKKDGVQIADQPVSQVGMPVSGLKSDTTYKFEVFAVYDNGTAEPAVLTVTTKPDPKPAEDVISLEANATYEKVDLSWKLPASENFKHVNIYRQTAEKTALIDRILLIDTVSAAPAGKKIFETNGTYFNDLTVEPETTYQYTVTTTSTDLVESAGVSKTVTTPKKPDPEIVGGEFEKDPATGSYIYRWTQPDTGQVKVIVGGKLYKTVNAADKAIVIPLKDMKFKGLDEPDVRLIPVGEDGKEGAAVVPPAVGGGTGGMLDKVDLPFNASELLGTGTGLFWLVGPFVLLALAFLLVPKLRNMMVRAFSSSKPDAAEGRFRSREGEREERIRHAREREVAGRREPAERQERSIRESRERVRQARMTRQERRSTP